MGGARSDFKLVSKKGGDLSLVVPLGRLSPHLVAPVTSLLAWGCEGTRY